MGNEGSHSISYGQTIDNDIKCVWKKLSNNKFLGREGHCSACVGSCLYVFGGVTLEDREGIESDQLVCFNQEKYEWGVIEGSGNVPCPRSAATMCSVGKSLYLFGGLSREAGWFNDMYKFDTDTKVWSKLSPEGTAPSPRDKTASAVIGHLVYVFGGFGPQNSGGAPVEPIAEEVEEEGADDNDEYEEESEDVEQDGVHFGWFNDLFIFNTETCDWSNPMQMNLGVPSPRAAHAMCSVEKHLVIFGGRDSQARRNDLHIFNTESRKWVADLDKIVTGRQPEPRSFHTMTTVGDRVVVLGGRGQSNELFSDFHIFDTKTHEWLQPVVEGEIPRGCGLHTTTVIGDSLVLYGGSSDFDRETMQCQTYHSEAYFVHTGEVLSGSSKSQQTSISQVPDTQVTKSDTKSGSSNSRKGQPPCSGKDADTSQGTHSDRGDYVQQTETESSPAKKPKTDD